MDKIRNIKHRLSLSVDKLSPTRKTKKDAKKSHSWATEGTASPTDVARKRPQSVPELDGLNSTPDSRTESSLDIETGAVGSAMSSPEVSRPMSLAEEDLDEMSSEGPPKKTPRREGRRSRPTTTSSSDDSSLMREVMKEVEKITTVTEDFKEKVENAAAELKENMDVSLEDKDGDRLPLLKEEQDNDPEPAEPQSSLNTSSSNISSETATLVESQESNDEDDSSAFVSLSSESSAVVTSTTKMEIEEVSTVTEQTTKTSVTKKESIYSKLKKVATKRDDSSGHKEPIYARIKPKLFLETSFKPIEPTSSKTSSPSGIVKPEPIYSSIKPKPSSGATPLTPPPSESGVSSPVTPSSPTSPGGHANPLSHFTAFCPGATSHPKEPIYSKVTPKDQRGGTLPRDSKPSSGTSTDYSKAGPIYTQPVPPIPTSEPPYKTFDRSSSKSDYGKVTVRASEISPPSRPSVVTIHNPGYEATKRQKKEEEAKAQEKEKEKKEEVNEGEKKEEEKKVKMDLDMAPPPPPPPPPPALPQQTQGSDSSIVVEQHDSDTESTGKNKLSRLVEELAQELEAVSRRVGYQGIDDDDTSKKEVLAKLLATYDVPKNLRRVEEADESEVAEAERTLVAAGFSLDELRLMDEENTETVYADVPDYSHDEFVIALDDENDPKYQSLTRAFRKGTSRRSSRGESPGKVSRRSVQVYMNVVNVLSALKVLLNSNSSKAVHVIGRMGTLARPYAQRVQHSLTDTTWIQRVIYHRSAFVTCGEGRGVVVRTLPPMKLNRGYDSLNFPP
ncbi:uncharacterized protein LOC143027104 [Oratosquilla oratoria]|uniref:uncharacterized protein LOC143027104 n=1 Tax=Oratosquilla oratoria TaxID=337810 RepID=UPI003F7624FB